MLFSKKEIEIDNILLDQEIREVPLNNRVFRVIILIIFFLFVFIFLKTLFLSLNGKRYAILAQTNSSSIIKEEGERGNIFDRYGKPLTENKLVYKAIIFSSIINNLDKKEKERTLQELENIFSISRENLLKKLSSFRIEMKKEFSISEALEIKKRKIPGLFFEKKFKRFYPYKELSHLTGYLSYSRDNPPNLKGQSGLEKFYNSYLKGEDGAKLIIENAQGKLLGLKELKQPQKGKDLYTFIDLDFQKFFYHRLEKRLKTLKLKRGLGLAVNPDNGEVLAMVSLPSFDANKPWLYFKNKNNPFFNRALSGIYMPGSVFKPAEAAAGLNEGIVSPKDKDIFCRGFIKVKNPYSNKFSYFKDWKPHGDVNFYKAIAVSCNVYFYRLGGGYNGFKGLGRDKIIKYFKIFRLNKKTGIDLDGESQGKIIPKNPWRLGDTYNLSIGQGQMLTTPLGILSYISAIANRGKIFQFRISQSRPLKILASLKFKKNVFKEVEKGMFETVEKKYGTAHEISPLPFKVAAKTGTPQYGQGKTNAIFVGYIPHKLAIFILIENSHEGSINTLPVAKDVLSWYYKNRIYGLLNKNKTSKN